MKIKQYQEENNSCSLIDLGKKKCLGDYNLKNIPLAICRVEILKHYLHSTLSIINIINTNAVVSVCQFEEHIKCAQSHYLRVHVQAKFFDKTFQNHAGHSVSLFFILISALGFLQVHRVKEKCRELMPVEKESLLLADSTILMWMHSF